MREYGSIALVEGTSSTILEFMSGGGEIVASYYLWRAAKFPERSLQALPAIQSLTHGQVPSATRKLITNSKKR